MEYDVQYYSGRNEKLSANNNNKEGRFLLRGREAVGVVCGSFGVGARSTVRKVKKENEPYL